DRRFAGRSPKGSWKAPTSASARGGRGRHLPKPFEAAGCTLSEKSSVWRAQSAALCRSEGRGPVDGAFSLACVKPCEADHWDVQSIFVARFDPGGRPGERSLAGARPRGRTPRTAASRQGTVRNHADALRRGDLLIPVTNSMNGAICDRFLR